jgi:formylglycine-generating enzyme required for sulfatase activity
MHAALRGEAPPPSSGKNSQTYKDTQKQPSDVLPKPKRNRPSSASPKNGAILTDLSWLEMVFVEGDSFEMGHPDPDIGGEGYTDNQQPVHTVELSNFYLGKTEVTQAHWRQVMGNDPPDLEFKDCDECPLEMVSWNDIQEFLQKLNELTGQTYRLPTEAEWEYAARGGNQSLGYQYAGSNDQGEVAWYHENSYDMGKNHPNYGTNPVALKKPNELGLYDMSGNVFELCADWYGKDYYAGSPQKNPQGPSSGTRRVVRGGSWYNHGNDWRVAYRFRLNPVDRIGNFGFRLCRDL